MHAAANHLCQTQTQTFDQQQNIKLQNYFIRNVRFSWGCEQNPSIQVPPSRTLITVIIWKVNHYLDVICL